MTNSQKIWPTIFALTIPFAGCASEGMAQSTRHLTDAQCRDLTALRNNAPITRQLNMSELAALRTAGYNPLRFDPHYPSDLQAAQRQVDQWYQTECQQPQPN